MLTLINMDHDTIAALATAPGGSIAIIRVSGEDALSIAGKVWRGQNVLEINERRLVLGQMFDPETGEAGDQAMAVYMKGPHTYTGEDVVEFQCHGGNFTAKHTLMCALKAGARAAEAGEFTKRAFVNGKLDLTQAEAVMDVISAGSEKAMQIAVNQLNGRFGNEIRGMYDQLSDLLAECEVRMDFVEEDLNWTPSEMMNKTLNHSSTLMKRLLEGRKDGEVLRDGVKVIIGGPPNAGKSSLMNHVLGRDRAIVTDIAGTTRDTLEEHTRIRGIPLKITDTAGIREADDIVEKTGIERSKQALGEAQLILWLMDLSKPLNEQLPPNDFKLDAPLIIILNKSDIAIDQELPSFFEEAKASSVRISIKSEDNLDRLYDLIEEAVWQEDHHHIPDVAVNARHSVLLEQAVEQIGDCQACIDSEAWELVSVHLRGALDPLGEILGLTLMPDILHTIFGRYCIGK
ncbi:tRNA uridine-5-carboxymethylaminomethyl(34) synthesis GTPase MnmE [Lentisphaera profundi]|uniref:tRNA modification GTPase MnmE n=1 Tax=Lentisphaera profundi TaxID=1658616 RepID=A0ABY7VZ31_9BACT|nr:tRNA uridine-5-carboxymethylaminomethyl(34) synthesis GTPase MnmE [Lentisphaera profundi]WDE99049.1 tRNA uridine-5-carboxymethylaminomethyl(34) synthesis GTPase MnmE [Lentisphaera profundi]